MPGGRKPGGGAPGMPGGPPKGIGGRANEGAPTAAESVTLSVITHATDNLLGGIMPMPRPAGIPRPGPGRI